VGWRRILAGVVMAVITVLAVMTGIPRFDGNERGQDERAILPQETVSKRASFRRRQISRAKSFGMKWNETAFWKVCKLLKRWWPGTEPNRRRRPFQGCYPR
jgi:hypothetical protein